MNETEGARESGMESPVRHRRSRLFKSLAVLVVGGLLYLSWQIVSIHTYGFRDDGRRADCAIVLGGAAWHKKPSPVLEERLNHAIKLYREGRVGALVLTGGFGADAPYSEAQVAKYYCRDQGVPEEDLLLETDDSQTTVQNLSGAKKVLDANGMESALIVSDPWHLKRGVLIARREGIDAYQSGTRTSKFESFKARSSFLLRELYLYHQFLLFGT